MFANIEHKLNYLQQHFSKQTLESWHQGLSDFFAREDIASEFSPAECRILSIDALYCFGRHRPWVDSNVFTELFIEFIRGDYQVTHEIAHTLCQTLCTMMAPPKCVGQSDDEIAEQFLRFIFVQSVCAADDHALMRDLGFGTQLLKRLRRTAKVAIENRGESRVESKDDTPAASIFSRIMSQMSDEIRRTPWALDLYRLQYLLNGPMVSSQRRNSKRVMTILFKFLLFVGKKRSIDRDKAQNLLQQRLDRSIHTKAMQLRAEDLLQKFEEAHLVFQQPGSQNQSGNLLLLAQTGQQITAEAFAVLATRKPLTAARILTLNAHYQEAVIRHLPLKDEQLLRELLIFHATRLAPPSLEQCILRLAKLSDQAALSEHLLNLLQHIDTPWTRAAVYKALATLTPKAEVGQKIAKMAQSERSAAVKDFAMQASQMHGLTKIDEH